MKRITAIILALLILLPGTAAGAEYDMEQDTDDEPLGVFREADIPVTAASLDIPAPCAILIEAGTGQVLYEKNADEQCRPASVTKVMTMLLIAEAVDSGTVSLEDTVTTSAFAASMGGSQVFLEEGEEMSLGEMFKCIVVSSANDAAVAVAEHLAGSESAFAQRMNDRAKDLGLQGTNFTNCTGLYDDDTHLTTARDLAIMSRELLSHQWVKDYTTIWTDTIRGGTFGLSNTNKLVRYYEGATGLKTGYTSAAGHCLAASAMRDGVEYIAVVLHCANSQERFDSARALLSFGFSNYTLLPLTAPEVIPPVPVTLGKLGYVMPVLEESTPVPIPKNKAGSVTKELELVPDIAAPVEAGQQLGTLTVKLGDEVLAELKLTAAVSVPKLTWWDVFTAMLRQAFVG